MASLQQFRHITKSNTVSLGEIKLEQTDVTTSIQLLRIVFEPISNKKHHTSNKSNSYIITSKNLSVCKWLERSRRQLPAALPSLSISITDDCQLVLALTSIGGSLMSRGTPKLAILSTSLYVLLGLTLPSILFSSKLNILSTQFLRQYRNW